MGQQSNRIIFKMRKFDILTIDGGGIKGLRSLFIIKEIEERMGMKSNEIFDLISGTSTGGIIAAMLSIGYSAEEVIELYFTHGPNIFKKKFLRFGIFRPKYDDSYLNKVIKEYVGEKKLSDCLTNVIIPAYNIETRDKILFKSYVGYNYPLFDVVRATVSAQSYFKPHEIDGQRHIDGGNVINNPSLVSYVEYKKRWAGTPINMLSIGTGREEKRIKKRQGNGGLLTWAGPTVDILMIEQSQQTDYFMSKLEPDNYMRIEPVSIAGDIKMDNASLENMLMLKADGEQTVKVYDSMISAFIKKIS